MSNKKTAINFGEFRFIPKQLSATRKPGISAYMRIKNEEQFVRLAILSHLDFYDEIIACYNDCTDNTPQILHDLAKQYPKKIKVYHYLPKVHPLASREHAQTPDDSIHGMANYSNYVLSKTTYQVATKLDADHLAIAHKLAPLIDTIRKDIAAGKDKLYYSSGINLMKNNDGEIGVSENSPFSGNGDYYYHPVNEKTYFKNKKIYEKLKIEDKKKLPREYIGIMYFHLKFLKKDFGYTNYSEKIRKNLIEETKQKKDVISFDEFQSCHYRKKLIAGLSLPNRISCALYANERLRIFKYKLTDHSPRLKVTRLARLAKDLSGIDLQRDALGWLE